MYIQSLTTLTTHANPSLALRKTYSDQRYSESVFNFNIYIYKHILTTIYTI